MVREHSSDPVPSRGKLLGTCAELADRSGLNPTLLRVIALVLLVCWFKLTLVTYCLGAVPFHMERR